MSANPTQPLNSPPPEPLAITEYVEKVRMVLSLVLVVAWVGILVIWTFKAPLLPGDVAGQAAGGFNMVLGVVVGYYFATLQQSGKKDGK